MSRFTKQMEAWTGPFGREYTRRNTTTLEATDEVYKRLFGLSRSQLNETFLGHLPRDARILEVGTNIGNQLRLLQKQAFSNLYGIELQWGAIDVARACLPSANFVQGSALGIPFQDGWFDVVFTTGLLIHIAPPDLEGAMKEIHRCSRRYIWGHEYWAPELTEVEYRGHAELLWKTDYAQLYQQIFPGLLLLREQRLPNLGDDNVDTMYLLEKPR